MSMLFPLLFGCNDNGNSSLVVFAPSISIEYTDDEGNNLLQMFRDNKTPGPSIEVDEKMFQIVSLTDEKGVDIEYSKITVGGERLTLAFSVRESYSLQSPVVVREYTLKYKIPPILGDDVVEEVMLVYKVDGMNSGFKEVWYNDSKCKYISCESFLPKATDTETEIENLEKELFNALYCGDVVSYVQEDYVKLILPINKK